MVLSYIDNSDVGMWLIDHWMFLGGVCLVIGVVIFNVVAFRHAYVMLHFSNKDSRTAAPEDMPLLAKLKSLLWGINIPRPENLLSPKDEGLEYSTHTFSAGKNITVEAWYIPNNEPKGTVLVFHGYSAAKDNLLPVAKACHELGYSVLMPEFRSSGGSNGEVTSIGYYESAEVIAAHECAISLSAKAPFIFYGHSMGGAAIMKAIAVDGFKPEAIIIEAVFNTMLDAVKNRFALMGLPSFPGAYVLMFWGGIQLKLKVFKHNPSDYARDIKCPVLMFQGSDDQRATALQAREIFNNLKCPKEVHCMDGVTHDLCVRAKPKEWKDVFSSFIEEHLHVSKR